MITVNISDGLGNQMYEYVYGYALAKAHGESLCLDTSDADNSTLREYMLDRFQLDTHSRVSYGNSSIVKKIIKRLRRMILYHFVKERGFSSFEANEYIFTMKTIRPLFVKGYWQRIEYFEMVEEDIRRQFVHEFNLDSEVGRCIEYLKSKETCAIHLRGDDIPMQSEEYFNKAVEHICNNKQGVEFIVFSNDYEQAKSRLDLLKVSYKLIEEFGTFTDFESFFLLSSCKNQIVSSSTFSIWAAILNKNYDKIVVAPADEKKKMRCPKDWNYF